MRSVAMVVSAGSLQQRFAAAFAAEWRRSRRGPCARISLRPESRHARRCCGASSPRGRPTRCCWRSTATTPRWRNRFLPPGPVYAVSQIADDLPTPMFARSRWRALHRDSLDRRSGQSRPCRRSRTPASATPSWSASMRSGSTPSPSHRCLPSRCRRSASSSTAPPATCRSRRCAHVCATGPSDGNPRRTCAALWFAAISAQLAPSSAPQPKPSRRSSCARAASWSLDAQLPLPPWRDRPDRPRRRHAGLRRGPSAHQRGIRRRCGEHHCERNDARMTRAARHYLATPRPRAVVPIRCACCSTRSILRASNGCATSTLC